jgi:hypothetical protein
MNSPNLLSICIAAFAGVFILLAILAALMRLILAVFPAVIGKFDAAVMAAITMTAQTHYPGTKITKIEEIK